MKPIDTFVDSVYQNIGGNRKEIQELKAEMKSHLLEAVHELRIEGKSEEEAIKIAINRFGGETEIRQIVGQLFKAQRTFAKWMLYLAATFLVVSLAVFLFLRNDVNQNPIEISNVATEIASLLEDKASISREMDAAIKNRINSTDFISSVKIYNVRDLNKSEYENYEKYSGGIFDYVEENAIKPDYDYNRTVWMPTWLKPRLYPYGNGDDQWLVTMEERYFHMPMTFVLFAGIIIYWTLFSIWAVINAYHQKRLNVGWTFTFILLNVLGFIVYRLFEKRVDI